MQKQRSIDNAKSVTMHHDYQKNVDLSIQWNRWLLEPIGVWPKSHNSTRIRKCFFGLIIIICYGLISFEFVSCFLYLIVEVDDAYNKLRLIGPLSFFLMSFTKYYLLSLHEDDIHECVERIKWDWKNAKYVEDRNVMVEYANYGRRLVAICVFFVYSSFAFYYIVKPISLGKIVVAEENLTFIPIAFPFSKLIADVRYSPTNEIVVSIQILTGVFIHMITSAACSLAAVFAVHACGQMKVLMTWLEHLVNGRSDMSNTVDGRIASIVSQHVRILKFLAFTEKALQQISFVEFLGCTTNLCLLGYYTIMEWNVKEITFSLSYIILIASFTFNIFIFCYIGELVAEQCKQVGEMTYMIEWHQLSGKKKLGCMLIIAMSNSSIKFTAGNMVELSISTFSDVIKTSVAFLNMLRAIT
ncbi:odorant receptor 82a-like [Xylocopa sonorina]|uniref:odorant receptor 82a-like n=1 Tax=Xylocopa sonorina TaxID=1818115 RepID=UPI00403AD7C1